MDANFPPDEAEDGEQVALFCPRGIDVSFNCNR